MVGVILTVYGEEPERVSRTIPSFWDTLDTHAELVVHATKLGPETKEALAELGATVIGLREETSLTVALNEGIRHFLTNPQCEAVGWIHTDMLFPEPWLGRLLDRLHADLTIGKLCPCNLRDGGRGSPNDHERPGNETPWIIRRAVFEAGAMFDEGFLGCSWEDWALNREIMKLGWTCIISPVAWIMHEGMQTRWKYRTSDASISAHNGAYYFKKYGTWDPPV